MRHRIDAAPVFLALDGEVGVAGHHRASGADRGFQRAEIRRAA